MNFIYQHLPFFLRVAALTQLGVALLNLSLIRIMRWQSDLERMPLLLREVFRIHVYFISVTLAIFGVLTWRFADAIARNGHPLCTWLALGIGCFWGVRSIMQWSHYNTSHWRGDSLRTAIHWMLFLGYGALAAVYSVAAAGGVK